MADDLDLALAPPPPPPADSPWVAQSPPPVPLTPVAGILVTPEIEAANPSNVANAVRSPTVEADIQTEAQALGRTTPARADDPYQPVPSQTIQTMPVLSGQSVPEPAVSTSQITPAPSTNQAGPDQMTNHAMPIQSQTSQSGPDQATSPSAPLPAVPQDNRQVWLCVTPEGPRTEIRGVQCPPFHSNDHFTGVRVTCPTCGSQSVRKPLSGEAF